MVTNQVTNNTDYKSIDSHHIRRRPEEAREKRGSAARARRPLAVVNHLAWGESLRSSKYKKQSGCEPGHGRKRENGRGSPLLPGTGTSRISSCKLLHSYYYSGLDSTVKTINRSARCTRIERREFRNISASYAFISQIIIELQCLDIKIFLIVSKISRFQVCLKPYKHFENYSFRNLFR